MGLVSSLSIIIQNVYAAGSMLILLHIFHIVCCHPRGFHVSTLKELNLDLHAIIVPIMKYSYE